MNKKRILLYAKLSSVITVLSPTVGLIIYLWKHIDIGAIFIPIMFISLSIFIGFMFYLEHQKNISPEP